MTKSLQYFLIGLTLVSVAVAASAESQDPPSVEARSVDDDDLLLEDSNIGYIDSAIIGKRLRIRFDAASGSTRPDRAEFLYGKCDCYTAAAGQDSASPGPAQDLDFQEYELSFEYPFAQTWSSFVELPLRRIDLTFPPLFARAPLEESGIGDIRVGVKHALVVRPDRYLTLQLRAYLPTGDAERGMGTDHASLEPAILFFRRLSSRVNLESELRLWYPLSGSSDPLTGAGNSHPLNSIVGRVQPPDPPVDNDGFAGEILRYGIGLSFQTSGKLDLTPVVELVGWHVLGGFATPNEPPFLEDASGVDILNLKLGVRIRGSYPGSFYVGYGLPLTSDDWYESVVRLEYVYSR